jgi:Outer membrane protein beta-barrel domain
VGFTLGRSDGVNQDPAIDDDISHGFTAGMRLDSRWAVELFWRNFAFASGLADAIFGGDGDFRPDTHTGLAGLYRLPMSDNVSAYARLGLGKTRLVANRSSLFEENPGPSDRKSITDPSVGAGVEIGTLRRVGVKLEATRFTKSGVKTYLVGLDIKF